MAHSKNHDYHILSPSINPFLGAVAAFAMLTGVVRWMHGSSPWLAVIGLVAVLYVMFTWWADVIDESNVGDHTPVVRIGLRYGFIFFITSEVMFFLAWFLFLAKEGTQNDLQHAEKFRDILFCAIFRWDEVEKIYDESFLQP